MANAKERIFRTPGGKLISEADVSEPGTGLAYAVGDEMTDEDHKAFGSGKAVKVDDEPRDVSEPNTIEVSNPATNTITNPAKKSPAKK